MVQDGLLMLVIMNPFAQTLYLSKLMQDTAPREFSRIYFDATLLTLGICLLCAYAGEWVIFTVFQVTLPAMRVFGGLINLQLSYSYVMQGPEGIRLFRGDVSQLAQQIALPIMVGAGVVWVSMRIGRLHTPADTAIIISLVLAINYAIVLLYHVLFSRVHGRFEISLVKYFGVAMRLNALLIGALSVQMILGGIHEFMTTTEVTK